MRRKSSRREPCKVFRPIEGLEPRLLLTGSQTFGPVTANFGLGENSNVFGITVEPSGKILAVGVVADADSKSLALGQFNADGSLDTTFGSNGLVTTGPGNISVAKAEGLGRAVFESDGSILVPGEVNGAFSIFHFDANGTLDTTFGEGGFTDPTPFPQNSSARSISIQPDGQILAAGSQRKIALLVSTSDGPTVAGDLDNQTVDATFTSDLQTIGVTLTSPSVAVVTSGSRWTVTSGSTVLDVKMNGDQSLSVNSSNGQTFGNIDELVRFNPDGSFDTSFAGGTGYVLSDRATDFDVSGSRVSVLQGTNGDILQTRAITVVYDPNFPYAGNPSKLPDGPTIQEPELRGFNADGTLDTSFGTDGGYTGATHGNAAGSTSVDLGTRPANDPQVIGNEKFLPRIINAQVNSAVMQSDGKILEAVTFWQFRSRKDYETGTLHKKFIGVIRFNTDGSLDTTFGGNTGIPGVAETQVNQQPESYATSIALTSDGKIVVGGVSGDDVSGDDRPTVIRYNSDGSLDTTFNGTGVLVFSDDFGPGITTSGQESSHFPALDVAVDGNGQIVAGGETNHLGNFTSDFALYRIGADGTLDSAFGAAPVSPSAVVPAFQVQQTIASGVNTVSVGNVNLTGSVQTPATLAVYGPDGLGLPGFDLEGAVNGIRNSALWDIQTDTITLAKGSEPITGDSFTIVLTGSDGQAHTFEKQATDEVAGNVMSGLLALMSSTAAGLGITAGSIGSQITLTGHRGVPFTVSVNCDESLGNQVANGTPPTFTASTAYSGSFNANAAIVQPDGKIIIAGSENDEFAVARYNLDGSLDNSFGPGNGSTISLAIFSGAAVAWGVTLDADGKTIVVGTVNGDVALARFNSNGTLDGTFGNAGTVATDLGTADDVGVTPIVLGDGSILVGATIDDGSGGHLQVLVRFNSDGSVDNAFGSNGIVHTSLVALNDSDAHGLAIEGQKILLAGGISGDFAVSRFNLTGSADATFGGGTVIKDLGGNDDADSIVLQGTDILVTGTSQLANTLFSAVVALTATGDLDAQVPPVLQRSGFSADGRAFNAGALIYAARAAALASGSGILVTDSAQNSIAAKSRISLAVVSPTIDDTVDLSTTITGIKPGSLLGGAKGKAVARISDTGFTGAVEVRLLLSTDATSENSVAQLGTFTLPMKAGKTKSHTFKFNYPAGLPRGSYQVLAVVDPSNQVAEAQESNNVAASSPIVLSPPFVDLAADQFVGLADTYSSQKSARIKVAVTNDGNVASSGPVTVTLSLSTDGVTPISTLATSVSTGAIKPGKTKKFTLKVPAGILPIPGTYYLIAVVANALDNNTANDTLASSLVTIV